MEAASTQRAIVTHNSLHGVMEIPGRRALCVAPCACSLRSFSGTGKPLDITVLIRPIIALLVSLRPVACPPAWAQLPCAVFEWRKLFTAQPVFCARVHSPLSPVASNTELAPALDSFPISSSLKAVRSFTSSSWTWARRRKVSSLADLAAMFSLRMRRRRRPLLSWPHCIRFPSSANQSALCTPLRRYWFVLAVFILRCTANLHPVSFEPFLIH